MTCCQFQNDKNNPWKFWLATKFSPFLKCSFPDLVSLFQPVLPRLLQDHFWSTASFGSYLHICEPTTAICSAQFQVSFLPVSIPIYRGTDSSNMLDLLISRPIFFPQQKFSSPKPTELLFIKSYTDLLLLCHLKV